MAKARDHDRVVIGVVPDGSDDPNETRWSYTVPADGKEPVLLTSYPGRTASWLLNHLGDDLRTGKLSRPTTVGVPEIHHGYLGAEGEIPLRLTLLSGDQALISAEHLTCQADPSLPVVMVTLPDPKGRWPEDEGCDDRVRVGSQVLEAVLTPEDR